MNLPEGSEISDVTRSLRASTLRGERITLATSETVPEGTWFEFEVRCLRPELMPYVKDAMRMGEYWGISQWRSSGAGTFVLRGKN